MSPGEAVVAVLGLPDGIVGRPGDPDEVPTDIAAAPGRQGAGPTPEAFLAGACHRGRRTDMVARDLAGLLEKR